MAKGFEMNIIAYAKVIDKKLSENLGFKYVSFEKLLKNSDIISIHCPLSKETEHMINMKNIKLIKKGAYLINTARGGIIETKALVHALDHGIEETRKVYHILRDAYMAKILESRLYDAAIGHV